MRCHRYPPTSLLTCPSHAFTHTQMCPLTHRCTHMHTHSHSHMHVQVHTHEYTLTSTHMYPLTLTPARTGAHTHMRTHILLPTLTHQIQQWYWESSLHSLWESVPACLWYPPFSVQVSSIEFWWLVPDLLLPVGSQHFTIKPHMRMSSVTIGRLDSHDHNMLSLCSS